MSYAVVHALSGATLLGPLYTSGLSVAELKGCLRTCSERLANGSFDLVHGSCVVRDAVPDGGTAEAPVVLTLVIRNLMWDRAASPRSIISEDGLTFSFGSHLSSARACVGYDSGKHSWDVKVFGSVNNCARIGIADAEFNTCSGILGNWPQAEHAFGMTSGRVYGMWANRRLRDFPHFDSGDIMRFELDLDARTLYMRNKTKAEAPKLMCHDLPPNRMYYPAASLHFPVCSVELRSAEI
eukprot:NODE_14757_length_1088_cov_6.766909.p1 GENE.NODE_14757_length_1088_cov_6.766909~~NODE_14757_length_1088_cov_6.766909.p1  ORF type:complete len:239 (+),score=56.35 NODE_14757_length_1088_cov_6.766909:167-883(+)